MSKSDLNEANRRALLRYYNSQTMTHGGYLIALVIGIITMLSRWTTFADDHRMWLLFIFILSLLLALGVNVSGRTFFWGNLSSEIIMTKVDVETTISKLHRKTSERVVETHWLTSHFSRTKINYIMVCFFLFSMFFSALFWDRTSQALESLFQDFLLLIRF